MRSLQTKLNVLIIGLVVTAHFTTGWLIMNQVEEAMHHENHGRGLAVATDLAHTCALSLISHDLAELRNYVGFSMQQEYVVQAMIIDKECRIIMHSDLTKVGTPYHEPCRGQEEKVSYSDHYSLAGGKQLIDILVPVKVAGVHLGSAIISYSHAGVQKEISTLKKKILITLLIGAGIAVICAVLLGDYIIRPIKHLSKIAGSLGSGHFRIRQMDEEYKDEIGELARTFYDMAARLEKEVCHDTLTGLYTRHVLQVRLVEECSLSLRHQQDLAIMMFDVDHFKRVNDTYGHLAGDQVLQDIAKIIQKMVRNEDCLARYGGEEFVLLLPQTLRRGALHVAEKIRQQVEKYPFQPEAGTTINVTISIGIALFPEDSRDFRKILGLADQALYRAKETGRNRVCQVSRQQSEGSGQEDPGGKGYKSNRHIPTKKKNPNHLR